MNVSLIPSLLSRLPVFENNSGVTMEGLRIMAQVPKANLIFMLRSYDKGYALWFNLKRNFGQQATGWLIAEKSKKVRVFAKAETAFVVARGLGLSELCIDLTWCHSENVTPDV